MEKTSMETAASNAPAPAAAPFTISSAAGPRASRKRRRVTACERCNKKRIRCDASVCGIPCYNCRNTKNQECRLIQSKRTRGFAGQFVNPPGSEERMQTPRPASSRSASTPTAQPTIAKNPLTTTAQEPEFSLNLERLDGDDRSPVILTEVSGREKVSERRVSSRADHGQNHKRKDSRPALIGESWFASYLTNNATRRHTDIHEPVEINCSNGTSRAHSATPPGEDLAAPQVPSENPTTLHDIPPQHLTKRLIESYFARFHVYSPILDERSFISSVDDGSVSATLLRCVLFVATIQCDSAIFHLLGYTTRMDFGDEFFALAKTSFESDNTSDRIAMLQSSYLLHYWWGQPTAFKDSLWWLSSSIRSAQCMGMNRSTRRSRMSQTNQVLWRRIWWCLYIRDRQLSFAVGVPMVINELDCDVEDLTLDDFPDESLETAYYIIGQVTLNRAASKLFYSHCCPTRLHVSAESGARYYAQQDIQITLHACHDNFPKFPKRDRTHYLSLTLEMCYNFYIINLQQRVRGSSNKIDINPEQSDLILEAANKITRLVEDAMIYWSLEYLPMMWVTATFAAMNVQYFAYLRKDRHDQDTVFAKLRQSLIVLKQFEQCYVVARWIRILWTKILDRSSREPKSHEHRRLASNIDVDPRETQAHLTVSDRNPGSVINDQGYYTPNSSTNTGYDQQSMLTETEYVGDDRPQMNPYFVDDWASIFAQDSYDAQVDLSLPHPWEYHGLQFLANLGSIGYNNNNDNNNSSE